MKLISGRDERYKKLVAVIVVHLDFDALYKHAIKNIFW